jgi:tetratricopeptide (TPR) repeat protein
VQPEQVLPMSEDDRDQHAAEELVNRYEKMLALNESYYFDIDEFEEIIDYYCEVNKFNHALHVINYAYTLFPENTTLMLRECQILAGMGRLTKALSRLKNLEKFEPGNQEVVLTMGSIYSQLREHKMSIELFKRALEMGGDEMEEEIYLEIALEYENMDRFDKAIEILQEALIKTPDNETLLYELAYCFETADRTAECVEYYKIFIDTHPFSFPAWYNLGNAYQKLDQLQESLEAYEFCIAVQPDFAPAYYNKAHALFKLDRFAEAILVFEETYAYEPPQAPIFCHIGECFEKLEEYDKALFYYRKSIQNDEFYADAYLGIGVVMDLQEKTPEAISFIERAIELEPENPDYHLFLVEVFKKQGHLAEAEAITETLVVRFPDNEDVWLDHSDLYFLKKDYNAALSAINEGWQKNPQSTAIGYRKVAYLLESGKTEEAQDLLLRMFMNDPEGTEELEEYYAAIKNNLFYVELIKSKNN